MPRNVLIELGMAIALNRPALLLRHEESPPERLPRCLEGLAGQVVCYSGEHTLWAALRERLPRWVEEPPEQGWWNTICIFGGRRCEYREAHPRAARWTQPGLACRVCHGADPGRKDFQAEVREVLERYSGVEALPLEDARPAQGCDLLVCGLCQAVRQAPFSIYRLTPDTPAETYLALGMSLALEAQFGYAIPKGVIVAQERDIPSLLRGYEVLEARNGVERKMQLRKALPVVLLKVRETA
jgi:hypothetical protein